MKELDYPMYPSHTGPRLHWSAVFAGAALSLALFATAAALGASIGLLKAPQFGGFTNVLSNAGFAASLWLLLCGAAASYSGGWVASRLSNAGRPSDGALYGLVCWSAKTLMAGVFVAVFFGSLMGMYMPLDGRPAPAAPRNGWSRLLGPLAVYGFVMLAVDAVASAFGGIVGARLYRPVPIDCYRADRVEEKVVVETR